MEGAVVESVYSEGGDDPSSSSSWFLPDENLGSSGLMSIRRISPRWNKLACEILVNKRIVVFFNFRHLNTFVDWLLSQVVFGQIPRFKNFQLNVSDLIRQLPRNDIGHVVHNHFSAIRRAVSRLDLHFGPDIRMWHCNLLIRSRGVPSWELCQTTILHLITYFARLEYLELYIPMIDLPEEDVPAFIPLEPFRTRSELRAFVLHIRDYVGSPVASETYFEILRNTIFSLIKATTQLTTLKVTGGYRLTNNFIIPGLINNSNHLKTTLKTLVITLEITIKDLDALTAAKFERLQEVEILLIPDDNEKKSIDGFLQTCCSTLTSLTLRFKRAATTNELLQNEPKKNAMNTFPSRGIGCQFPCLHTLTIDGYIKGIVRMHVMPILQKLQLYSCENLTFLYSDSFSVQTQLVKGGFNDGSLYNSLETLVMSRYMHTSSSDHPIVCLISPNLKFLRLAWTEFRMMTDLFQYICKTCPLLVKLEIVNCHDMMLSDDVLCGGGGRFGILDNIIEELIFNGTVRNDQLVARMNVLDTSSRNPGQISNLKDLKTLFISSSTRLPITDDIIYFGLAHCPQLEAVRFDFENYLTWQGKLLMRFILPRADISRVQFKRFRRII